MVESRTRIYLDYNASAPIHPAAMEAMADAFSMVGNPSSIHRDGRKIRVRLDEARDAVAKLVKVTPETITFTSGGTEANATAILGLLNAGSIEKILCSAIEHPSVLEHVEPAFHIRVGNCGAIDLAHLEELLVSNGGAVLVAVMFANNETGVLQPIAEVSELAHQYGALVLCDAVQAPGKVDFDAAGTGADFITLSAHKIGGPPGAGALINLSGKELNPLLVGGGQEKSRRSGTENSPGIIGFGAAAQEALRSTDTEAAQKMQSRFEANLLQAAPGAMIVGQQATRLPNTTCVAKEGIPADQQIINLDLAGISVSAGSACSSGKVTESHVLRAMGYEKGISNCAVRVSFGPESTWSELERFIKVWSEL